MTRYTIGDESYGGYSKHESVRVGDLVDPASPEGQHLFYNVIPELLAGRQSGIEGEILDFLPDDGDRNGTRPETLIYVGNKHLPVPYNIAAYACRELIHLDINVAGNPEN